MRGLIGASHAHTRTAPLHVYDSGRLPHYKVLVQLAWPLQTLHQEFEVDVDKVEACDSILVYGGAQLFGVMGQLVEALNGFGDQTEALSRILLLQ